jgi:actin-related protein 6
MDSLVVMENGACTLKAGIATEETEMRLVFCQSMPYLSLLKGNHSIIPNAVVRSKGDKMTYFGHEISRCRDYSSLHYRLPFEKVRLIYLRTAEQETIAFSQAGIPR